MLLRKMNWRDANPDDYTLKSKAPDRKRKPGSNLLATIAVGISIVLLIFGLFRDHAWKQRLQAANDSIERLQNDNANLKKQNDELRKKLEALKR